MKISKQKFEEKKKIINRVVIKLFHELDIEDFNGKAISNELGMSRSTLQYHFPTTTSIYIYLVNAHMDKFTDLSRDGCEEVCASWEKMIGQCPVFYKLNAILLSLLVDDIHKDELRRSNFIQKLERRLDPRIIRSIVNLMLEKKMLEVRG